MPKLLHVPLIRNVQHKTLDCDIYQGAKTVHPRFPPGTVDSSLLIGPIPAQGGNGAMGLYFFIETVEWNRIIDKGDIQEIQEIRDIRDN